MQFSSDAHPTGGDGTMWKQAVLQGFRDSCSLCLQGKVI